MMQPAQFDINPAESERQGVIWTRHRADVNNNNHNHGDDITRNANSQKIYQKNLRINADHPYAMNNMGFLYLNSDAKGTRIKQQQQQQKENNNNNNNSIQIK